MIAMQFFRWISGGSAPNGVHDETSRQAALDAAFSRFDVSMTRMEQTRARVIATITVAHEESKAAGDLARAVLESDCPPEEKEEADEQVSISAI